MESVHYALEPSLLTGMEVKMAAVRYYGLVPNECYQSVLHEIKHVNIKTTLHVVGHCFDTAVYFASSLSMCLNK